MKHHRYGVLVGAAAADRRMASLLEGYSEQRRSGQKEALRILVGRDGLRNGVTFGTAADILYAIGSPDTYRSLVLDSGWSAAKFERWYAEAIGCLLLRT